MTRARGIVARRRAPLDRNKQFEAAAAVDGPTGAVETWHQISQTLTLDAGTCVGIFKVFEDAE